MRDEKADTSAIQYSEEVAQVISHITAGTILPGDYVEIIFAEDIVAAEALNQKITNPFSFSPAIGGEGMWTSWNVLAFIPNKPLTSRINFTGELDLKVISDDMEDLDIDIKFYVAGRDLVSFSGNLELQNPNDPKQLVYRGKE